MKTYHCLHCSKESITLRQKTNKYCSHQCQNDYQYNNFINNWLSGIDNGSRKNGVSKPIKRYLLEQQNNKCAHCGISEWNGKPIILEVEHIDGNSNNNCRENLECICPNCHSQTSSYKGANRGKGRYLRRVRFAEGKSF